MDIIFLVNILIGVGLLLFLLITLAHYGYHDNDEDRIVAWHESLRNNAYGFNTKASKTVLIIWCTLTLSLIYYYSCLVYTLNKSFS